MTHVVNRLINVVATALFRLRRRPDGTSGAHAIALTPSRKVVLVRLRYAPGWRLPGGGRAKEESLRDAVLRELREEIGMTSHSGVRESPVSGVLVVDDVIYQPRKWSWEVEAICEASIDKLPSDVSPRTLSWLKAARGSL